MMGRPDPAGRPTRSTAPRAGSAPDGAHRPIRLQERRIVDAVPGQLAPGGDAPGLRDVVVAAAAADKGPEVGLVLGEQAGAYLTVGRQPGPVAIPAKRPG